MAQLTEAFLIDNREEMPMLAHTLEGAKRRADESVMKYFDRPTEWREAGANQWEGTYADGPHSHARVFIFKIPVED